MSKGDSLRGRSRASLNFTLDNGTLDFLAELAVDSILATV
jgi:hypothetical protein